MTRGVQRLASIVGQAIVAQRKRKGLTQSELAERLGMGPDSLSRIEKGVVAPRFPRLEAIARALDCPVADLFRMQNDPLRVKFESLADLMRPMPPPMQDEVLRLLEHVVAVTRRAAEKS